MATRKVARKVERRKHVRKEVLDTFQVFISIPKLGPQKIYLKDLSKGGISFSSELKSELDEKQKYNIFFHINPSLKLPLQVEIKNISKSRSASVRVGCQFFKTTSSGAYKSYLKFIDLLDNLRKYL